MKDVKRKIRKTLNSKKKGVVGSIERKYMAYFDNAQEVFMAKNITEAKVHAKSFAHRNGLKYERVMLYSSVGKDLPSNRPEAIEKRAKASIAKFRAKRREDDISLVKSYKKQIESLEIMRNNERDRDIKMLIAKKINSYHDKIDFIMKNRL